MPLAAADRLGPYEIVSPLGKGGMGEVWKARDPRLNRDVAIKVAAQRFTDRFEREARAIAALNHPNICTLYDVGPNYLVMELIEGPTLADRIAQGPFPLEEALGIARQIAEALEAAHDKNIVHRDLKPANVKIRPDGSVKVLDFGLAKAGVEVELTSDSPTMTAETQIGKILGTAGYMSPEQARGQKVDKRADVWAFGVVLYEMVTGRRLFDGSTVSDSLAATLTREPDLTLAPAKTRLLLARCLERDPKRRLRDIGDAMAWLDAAPSATAPSSPPRRAMVGWMAAAALGLAALGVSFVHLREKPPAVQSLRYEIPPPGIAPVLFPALSPDGRYLAFVTSNGGPNQLWVRAMDTLQPRVLAGTDGASYPFWSPDSAWLGFFADGKLTKIAVAGGPSQVLCDADSGRGGTWNRDGVILFSPGPADPIFRVPAAGGRPVAVTKLVANGSAGNRFPVFLPDGVHFLYSAGADKPDEAGVFAGSLKGGAAVRLLPDATNALYAPPAGPGGTAHILFRRENTLMAQPFDAPGLKTTGEMFPLAEDVPISVNNWFGAFTISENGMLAFRSGSLGSSRELVWFDRAGRRSAAVGKPGDYQQIAVSPDEKTVAVAIDSGSQSDIWLQDLARGVLSRFTLRPGIANNPVWSPDRRSLVFALQALGWYSADIYQNPVGGNGQEELLVHSGINGFPSDWSPDGRWIVFQQTARRTGLDLWLLPMNGDRRPIPYLQTPFDETNARFSPDGKWMAYQSSESGRFQVYVQSFPRSGTKYQISASGGEAPHWRRDGKELFYVSADQKLMAVPVKLGATVEAGTPLLLFPIPGLVGTGFSYAAIRDGQRFLVNVPAGGDAAPVQQITIVTNWDGALPPQSH